VRQPAMRRKRVHETVLWYGVYRGVWRDER